MERLRNDKFSNINQMEDGRARQFSGAHNLNDH